MNCDAFTPTGEPLFGGLPDIASSEEKFGRISEGDLFVFHRKARAFAFASIGCKLNSSALGRILWPPDRYTKQGYSRIFTLVRLGYCSISLQSLSEITLLKQISAPGTGTHVPFADLTAKLLARVQAELDTSAADVGASLDAISMFISYAHVDSALVDELVSELKSAGATTTWRDRDQLLLGESLIDVISRGIHNSDFFVAVMSQASLASRWCHEELAQATTRGVNEGRVFVLPLRVGDIEMPRSIGHRYWTQIDAQSVKRTAELLVRDARIHKATGRVEP